MIRVLTNRTELTVRPPGRPRPGPRPAPSGRPASLGPVGRQPPACAGRAQNLVSAGGSEQLSPGVCLFFSETFEDAPDARRVRCLNSVPRRMSGAHAPRSAIPHMSPPGCEPARCVHRAASGSRRPGVVERDYPDADSCPRRMSRTHARTGGRRANGAARLPLCRSASRFKLAWHSSAFFGGGRAVGVCMTVRRPLLPRVICWGIHR